MKHASVHTSRNAAILAIVTVAFVGVGADVVLPGHAHVPIAIAFLAIAAYLALHDRIHSVLVTHRRVATPKLVPVRASRNLRVSHAHASHTRGSRPGWM